MVLIPRLDRSSCAHLSSKRCAGWPTPLILIVIVSRTPKTKPQGHGDPMALWLRHTPPTVFKESPSSWGSPRTEALGQSRPGKP